MLSVDPFTKTGAAPLTRQRLRNEAATLRRAAHPDIVRLVALHDLDDHTQLHTERIGDQTLLDAVPTDGDASVAMAATLAATVADLHEIDLVHGRLGPDHVMVREDGRPMLCGFAEAGPGDPTVDIHALGTLFELLAGALPRSGSRRADRAVTTLLTAAEHARTASPTPSAADLVKMLKPSGRKFDPPRRPVLIGVGAVAVVVALLAVAMRSFSGSEDPSVLTLAPADTVSTTLSPRSSTAPPTSAAPSTTVPAVVAEDPQPDDPQPGDPADSTPAESTPVDGDQLRFEANGAIYSTGTVDDIAVVGDWDCDGVAGAALLRRSDGGVFVFDRLATSDVPVVGRLVAEVPDAIDLEVIDQDNGCSTLTARFADGSPQLIQVGA